MIRTGLNWDAVNAEAARRANLQEGKGPFACAGAHCRRKPTSTWLRWRLCDACDVEVSGWQDVVADEWSRQEMAT